MAELTEQTFQKLIDEQKKTTQALGQVSMLQKENIDVGKDNVKQGELFGPPISPEEQEKQNKKMQKVRDAKDAKEPSWFGKVGAFIMGGKARKKENKKEQESGFKRFGKMIGGGFKELGSKLYDQLPSKSTVKGFFTKSLLAALFLMMPKILNSQILKDIIRVLDEKLPKVFTFLKEGFGKVAKLFKEPSIENFFNLFKDGASGGVVAGIGLLTAMFLPFGVGRILRGTLGLAIKGLISGFGLMASGVTALTNRLTGKDKDKDKDKDKKKKKPPKKSPFSKILKASKVGLKAIPGLGLIATAAFGIYDGVRAGLEESKKETATVGSIARESISGVLSGLTFGIVSQETISKGFQNLGTKFEEGAKFLKDGFNTGLEFIKGIEIPTMEEVGEGITKAGLAIKENFGKVTDKLGETKDMLVKSFEDVTGIELPTMEDVTSKLKEFGNNMKEKAMNLIPSKEKVGEMVGKAKNWLKGLSTSESDIKDRVNKGIESAMAAHDKEFHQAKAIDDFGGVDRAMREAAAREAQSTNIVSADNSVRSNSSTTVVQSENITPSYGGYRMTSSESDY